MLFSFAMAQAGPKGITHFAVHLLTLWTCLGQESEVLGPDVV